MLYNGNLPPQVDIDKLDSGYKFEGKEILTINPIGRPPKIRNPDYYTIEKKTDAATLYCVYGDVNEVSKILDIPLSVLREWKEEPWWIEIQKKVFVEQNDRLSARISTVLDKAVDQISDRLDHGDTTYNPKTGEVTRKPVEARVLASLFETLSHQRRITRGEPTAISSKIGTDNRLEKLEQAFLRFSKATEIVAQPCEVISEGSAPEHESLEENTDGSGKVA